MQNQKASNQGPCLRLQSEVSVRFGFTRKAQANGSVEEGGRIRSAGSGEEGERSGELARLDFRAGAVEYGRISSGEFRTL